MDKIVRNVKNNVLYISKGDNTFKNIITKVEGLIDGDKAKLIFSISLDATELLNKYPNIKTLIEECELRLDILF